MISFKSRIKSLLIWIRFQRENYLDGIRYLHCVPGPKRDKRYSAAQLESNIIRRYHVIEKGLSMPDFRPRFGEEMVRQLAGMLLQWDSLSSAVCGSNSQIEAARAVLCSYRIKHKSIGVDVSDILSDDPYLESSMNSAAGGVREYHTPPRDDREAMIRMLKARCSVRHFNAQLMPERAAIERAVAAAIQTPSVCNRQTWRAHLFEGNNAQKVHALQDGNRGFGHTIPAVLVVTSDLRGMSHRSLKPAATG